MPGVVGKLQLDRRLVEDVDQVISGVAGQAHPLVVSLGLRSSLAFPGSAMTLFNS